MDAAKKLLHRLSGAQGNRRRDEFPSGDREPFLPLRQRSVTVPDNVGQVTSITQIPGIHSSSASAGTFGPDSIQNTGHDHRRSIIVTREFQRTSHTEEPQPLDVHWVKTTEFVGDWLEPILRAAEYGEVWGVNLNPLDTQHVPTLIVAGKFLKACNYDVNKAAMMLKTTLAWRKRKQPRTLMMKEHAHKFEGLGFITTHQGVDGRRVIVTWNLWKNKREVRAQKAITGDLNEYLEWRIALIEEEIDQLGIAAATVLPTDPTNDPYRSIQVHDFTDFKFANGQIFANVKAITAGIKLFSDNYPELVSQKEFVGVPFAMHVLIRALKAISPDAFANAHSAKKASSLARKYLPGIVGGYPYEYNAGHTSMHQSTMSVYHGFTTRYQLFDNSTQHISSQGRGQSYESARVGEEAQPAAQPAELKVPSIDKITPAGPAPTASKI